MNFKDFITSDTLSKDLVVSTKKLNSNSSKNWDVVTATGEKVLLTIQIKK